MTETIVVLGVTGSIAAYKALDVASKLVQNGVSVRTVMTELADAGNVIIVGRAGQIILGNRPDTLHVRVIAPVSVMFFKVPESSSALAWLA